MSLRNIAIAVIVVVLIAGGGIFGWIMISGGDGTPTTDISDVVPTLDMSASDAQAADESGMVDDAAEATEAVAEESAAEEAEVVEGETSEEAGIPLTAVYRIIPEESEARFLIDEDLRGERITVVGATNQVGGDIAVNMANPAESQVGTILINARTLETDNAFRNRAIRGQILKSSQDEFEFIEFVPTAVSGMPETVAVGEPVTFQIEGDLTVAGTTQPVTFEATVTVADDQRMTGSATTTVQWRDFNLTIPDVPGVANISEDVGLEIDFIAQPAADTAS